MKNPLLYFLIFLKAALFSTGGMSSLPSLHQDMLANHWATDTDFGQAVAIGQVSPGPSGLWVVCLGYLTYGWLGAFLALIGVTIPPFVVLAIAGVYERIEQKSWVQGLMHGFSLAVVGLLLVSVWSILSSQQVDWRSLLIAVVAFGLTLTQKVPILVILGIAALLGYLLYALM